MKKKYKITPDQYRDKIDKMYDITYKTGYDGIKNADRCSRYLKEKYDKYHEETSKMDIPEDKLFFMNEVIYNLYLNRNEDEPVTSKELYKIIETVVDDICSYVRTRTY